MSERAVPVTSEPPPLWREVLGARLRRMRQRRRLTLTETAALAGISPQYLSEVERGRKDPSSEMISAITGALELDLAQVLDLTARDLRSGHTLHLLPRDPGASVLAMAA